MEEENKNIPEKYLPIGSIVLLKGGKRRVMISGFCNVAKEQPTKIWDYSGCLFPEGFLSIDQICLFDHEQIEKVYHLGLIDDDEKAFKEKLSEVVEEISKKSVNPEDNKKALDEIKNNLPEDNN